MLNIFDGCRNVTFITIGNSVTTIGDYLFDWNPELRDIYCYAENVPTASNAFEHKYENYYNLLTLHVPASSINSYKSTAPWNRFTNIVPLTDNNPSPTGIKTIESLNQNETSIYDLNGRRLTSPQKGINIAVMRDGTVRKIYKK